MQFHMCGVLRHYHNMIVSIDDGLCYGQWSLAGLEAMLVYAFRMRRNKIKYYKPQ